MKGKLCLALVLTLVVALTLAGCDKKADLVPTVPGLPDKPAMETIKIGFAMPVTGVFAPYGQSSINSVILAFEEINNAGGVLGKHLELVDKDSQSTVEGTVAAFQWLIEVEQVVAIIGSVLSSHTLAGAPIAQEAGIPVISPSSLDTAVTSVGDYIFRACFIDPFQGQIMANFALNKLHVNTAAIIMEQESEYSRGLAINFGDHFEDSGGIIVHEVAFGKLDTDFTSILASVKAENPQFIYIPSYYDTVGPILRQARDMGITAYFGGGDGWDSPELFELAGDAADGSFFSTHYSPDADTPEVNSFLIAYQEKYNKNPDTFAALAYDAAYIMAQAIKRAGSSDGLAIRDAMAALTFTGVTGSFVFDENRNPIKDGVIIGIENQQQIYKTTVSP